MPKQGAKNKAQQKKPARPRCHKCNKAIHVPTGWSVGPAVRRHYWKHHRDVMQVVAGGSKR